MRRERREIKMVMTTAIDVSLQKSSRRGGKTSSMMMVAAIEAATNGLQLLRNDGDDDDDLETLFSSDVSLVSSYESISFEDNGTTTDTFATTTIGTGSSSGHDVSIDVSMISAYNSTALSASMNENGCNQSDGDSGSANSFNDDRWGTAAAVMAAEGKTLNTTGARRHKRRHRGTLSAERPPQIPKRQLSDEAKAGLSALLSHRLPLADSDTLDEENNNDAACIEADNTRVFSPQQQQQRKSFLTPTITDLPRSSPTSSPSSSRAQQCMLSPVTARPRLQFPKFTVAPFGLLPPSAPPLSSTATTTNTAKMPPNNNTKRCSSGVEECFSISPDSVFAIDCSFQRNRCYKH